MSGPGRWCVNAAKETSDNETRAVNGSNIFALAAVVVVVATLCEL